VIVSRAEVLLPSDSSTRSGLEACAIPVMPDILAASGVIVLRFYRDLPLVDIVAARVTSFLTGTGHACPAMAVCGRTWMG
jgi:hypothetical protein